MWYCYPSYIPGTCVMSLALLPFLLYQKTVVINLPQNDMSYQVPGIYELEQR